MPGNFAESFENLPATGSGELRSVGAFVSDLGTKAVEGMKDMGSRFGNSVPFLQAGAGTQTFASLMNPTALSKAVSGVIGSAFGASKGLLPDTLINNLVATKEPKASAVAINQTIGTNTPTEDRSHIISLTSIIDKIMIEFEVMPEIVENRTAGYEPVSPPQFPGSFQKYKGTESTQWTINATLISRTSDEATKNLKNMNLLRSWTMPFFGANTQQDYPSRVGAPPPVLMLKGLRGAVIGPMPVVITSLSWNWPKDVDYIPATSPDGSASNIPFPTVIQIAIQCVESLSVQEFNQFSLRDFALGKMIAAYSKPISFNENYGNETRAGRGPSPASEGQSTAQTVTGAGAGRGFINPPNIDPTTVISEARNAVVTKFKSGGGGDFGGAGAGGGW